MNALIDAALQAAIACVMSLTYRRLRLLDLAAGSWVVLGGWLTVAAASPHPTAYTPLRATVLPLFLLPFFLQTTFAAVLAGTKKLTEASYLFISLASAVFIGAAGPYKLLQFSGNTIPDGYFTSNLWSVFAIVTTILIAILALRSSWWAQLVFLVHAKSDSVRSATYVWCLVGLEILLLLGLGSLTGSIHKGLFPAAEYGTVIPLVALVLSKGNLLKSDLMTFVVAFFGAVLVNYGIVSSALTNVAALLLVLGGAVVYSIKHNPLADARPNFMFVQATSVPRSRGLIWSSIALVLYVTAEFIWSHGGDESVQTCLWISALAGISQVSELLVGVSSVCWPAFGIIASYSVAKQGIDSITIPVVAGIIGVCGVYVLFQRLVKYETAMVIDIGVLVVLREVVVNSPSVSGVNNVVFGGSPTFALPQVASSVNVALFIGCMAIVWFLSRESGWFRNYGMALADLHLGKQHGYRVILYELLIALALVTGSLTATLMYHSIRSAITPTELSLEFGILVLLLGKVGCLAGSEVFVFIILVVYGIGETVLGRSSFGLSIFVSAALISLGAFPALGRVTDGRTASSRSVRSLAQAQPARGI